MTYLCDRLKRNKKDTFLERNPNEVVAECQGRIKPTRKKIHNFFSIKIIGIHVGI